MAQVLHFTASQVRSRVVLLTSTSCPCMLVGEQEVHSCGRYAIALTEIGHPVQCFHWPVYCESLFHILQCSNNNENLHIFLACFYSCKLQYRCPNKFSQNFVINTATCTDKQSSTAFHKFILEFITFPYCLYSTSK